MSISTTKGHVCEIARGVEVFSWLRVLVVVQNRIQDQDSLEKSRAGKNLKSDQ